MFDFSVNNIQAVSNNKKRLDPWEIHTVKFVSAEKASIQGRQDPSKTYDLLRLRFENEDGYYEESIFYPTEKDGERRVFQNRDGHDYETPSNWERTKTLISQVASALNPEGFKKMQELSSKFKSFDDMVKVLIKILEPAKGTETQLKLIGRVRQNGSIEAVLPKFVAINRNGELFTSDNFIGKNLFFTPYEEGQRAKFKNATPTAMPADTPAADDIISTTTSDDTSDDIDLTSLLD